MTKLLLCSISALVLGFYGTRPAFADSLTELVDKQKEEQTQTAEQETSVFSRSNYVKKALQGTTSVVQKEDTTYDTLLSEAVAFHNFVKLLDEQLAQVNTFKLSVQEKELDKVLVSDFDSCQVDLLSDYFAAPKTVWKNLKKAADSKITEYNETVVAEAETVEKDMGKMLARVEEVTAESNTAAADIKLSSSARTEMNKLSNEYGVDTKGKTSNVSFASKTAAEEVAEANADDIQDTDIAGMAVGWQVGYTVLNSFFPNQDAWGERKTPTTASLPLWKDQKYLYNEKVWKPKYKEIVEYCKTQKVGKGKVTLTLKEPVISDAYKYDYYFYDKVKSAHKAFVKATESQGCILTSAMKAAPESAPRPLPPVYEDIMILTGDNGEFTGIYPQNPMNPAPDQVGSFLTGTLWEAYKANGYKDTAKDGEFSTYFKVSGSTISPTKEADNITANRISKYVELKNNAERSEKIYQAYLEATDEFALAVKDFAEKHSVDLPEDINYLNADDLTKVKKILTARKDELIKDVKTQMGEKVNAMASMTTTELKEDKDLAFLNALEKDKDGLVVLTRETVMAFDDALKEAKANQKLKSLTLKNGEDYKAELLDKKNHKFEKQTCMQQDKDKALNLETVEIK